MNVKVLLHFFRGLISRIRVRLILFCLFEDKTWQPTKLNKKLSLQLPPIAIEAGARQQDSKLPLLLLLVLISHFHQLLGEEREREREKREREGCP